MAIGGVDSRSSDTAYATKDNIVVPAYLTAAQLQAREARAASIQELNNPPQRVTAVSNAGARTVTDTVRIKQAAK